MEAEIKILMKVSVWVAALMTHARFASRRTKPGMLRLLALIPVVCLLPWLPWHFTSIHLRAISAFFLAWLGVFKLLLLAFDTGPLSPSLPPLSFLASAALPVKLKTTGCNQKIESLSSNRSDMQSFISDVPKIQVLSSFRSSRLLPSAVKAALLAALVSVYRYKEQFHLYLLLSMYCVHVYLSLEVVLAGAALVAELFLPGLELEPQFDSPFLAASLQEFWGRRWNLMVSAILRPSVYLPVRARLGTAAGIIATFVVSGIMHEVMYYYLTLAPPTGEVAAFFVLHGVCVVVEGAILRAGWWRPPPIVAVPVTVGFVAVTGFWLFFPQILRHKLDEEVLAECSAMMRFMERAGRKLLSGPIWFN